LASEIKQNKKALDIQPTKQTLYLQKSNENKTDKIAAEIKQRVYLYNLVQK